MARADCSGLRTNVVGLACSVSETVPGFVAPPTTVATADAPRPAITSRRVGTKKRIVMRVMRTTPRWISPANMVT